ncbi:MAG: AcrR family transcriptional regulator [Halieaceae bacterium]|jgi:AcrR family transcriptional regulator
MQIRKPTKPKGTKTKQDILEAFTACVRKQGYAKTSMVDVAKEAKLFPSNLFYYFESKDELLRVCFKRQCDIIVRGLEKTGDYDLEGKIDYIADFLFSESASVNQFTTGFMYEAIGVSVSDSILKKNKSEMDRCCKNLLADVFIGIDASESIRNEKADILYSLLAGSKLNGYFDTDYNPKNGQKAFTKVFRIFCDRSLTWPAS